MDQRKPSVLFVCSSNRGKSQMAAALLKHQAGDGVEVHSAGTNAAEGKTVNPGSAAALAEVGVDMSTGFPKSIDPQLLRTVDRVVVLGGVAQIESTEAMAGRLETWLTDEPSERGIEGEERMRLIRDDITARVARLHKELMQG